MPGVASLKSGKDVPIHKPLNITMEWPRLQLLPFDGGDWQAVLERRITERMGEIGFTPRQREVIWLIFEGKTDKEIAAELGISEHTVGGHMEQISKRMTGERWGQFRIELILDLIGWDR